MIYSTFEAWMTAVDTEIARRVLVNGRWQRPDPQSFSVLRWLKGQGESK